MRYFCTDCSYIYDEAIGDPEMSIEAGGKLEDMSEFYCSNCEAGSDMFQPIVEEILYAENPWYISGPEKEHIAHIMHIDEKEVEVCVWEDMHPSGEDHRITTIGLYDEYGDMIEEHFFEVDEDPVYVFHTEDLDEFEIRTTCIQHGTWSTGMIENKKQDSQ